MVTILIYIVVRVYSFLYHLNLLIVPYLVFLFNLKFSFFLFRLLRGSTWVWPEEVKNITVSYGIMYDRNFYGIIYYGIFYDKILFGSVRNDASYI